MTWLLIGLILGMGVSLLAALGLWILARIEPEEPWPAAAEETVGFANAIVPVFSAVLILLLVAGAIR